MNQVVTRLTKTDENYQMSNYKLNIQLPNKQGFNTNNTDTSSCTNGSLHGELSQIIENFSGMNTNQIINETIFPSFL